MGDYEDLTFLWLPPHPTSPPDYPILDEEHKIAYGIPQIVAAFIGFPVNIGMLIVALRRTKDLCSTFFYFILAQLCLLNLIQMQSHMVAAIITLVADTGPKFSMLTIPLGYAACFSSDLLRGVISLHRMTLIAFPHRAKDIPKWVFMTILIFDIFLFFFVAIKFYTPQGAAYFSPRQLLFLKFDKIWIFSQITNQIRICCNYISLVAGALSYAVITPLLLFHKRKLKKADYTITIQLFVTFCCSIICFVGWEVVLPWADDSTPTTAVLINFISQLLWVLQCSQEPAVLFIFNNEHRSLSSYRITPPPGFPGGGTTLRQSIQKNAREEADTVFREFANYNGGPGVQHVALNTDDLVATVEALRARGVELLDVPAKYYELVREKLSTSNCPIEADIDRLKNWASSSISTRRATSSKNLLALSMTARRCSLNLLSATILK
ncbi:unnamed protein product, partial [Mesorhabditis spiculigera]